MQLLTGYNKPVIALALTPDGKRLFSVAQGQKLIWEWDLADQRVKRKLKFRFMRGGVHALAVSPRGDFLVATTECGRGVDYWPLDGRTPRGLAPHSDEMVCTSPTPGVAVHPDGRLVAAPLWAGFSHGYQTWDVGDGDRNERYSGHSSYVDAVAFSPGGGLVATTSRDGTVRIWNLGSTAPAHVLTPRVTPGEATFRPGGQELAVSGARSVFVYDVRTGALVEELTGHGGNVKAVAYSPDGKHLAAACLDGTVVLRDAATRQVVGRRHLEVGRLGALAWHADSSGVVVGGEKLIAVCELAELLGQERAKPKARGEPLSLAGHNRKVVGLCYSRDGKALASWSDSELRAWDLSGGAGQARPRWASKALAVRSASFSSDGSRLALMFSVEARDADAGTGAPGGVLAQDRYFTHFSFTPSGRRLVAHRPRDLGVPLVTLTLSAPGEERAEFQTQLTARDCPVTPHAEVFGEGDQRVYLSLGENTVSRWTPAGGEVVPLIRQRAIVAGFSVSRDERTLVTVGGNSALVWDLSSGRERLLLKHPLACSGVAFLPGGRLLTSCYDGLVRVWELSGGAELFAFDLGMGKVYSLAASPDGMTFAAGVEKKSRIVLMDVPE